MKLISFKCEIGYGSDADQYTIWINPSYVTSVSPRPDNKTDISVRGSVYKVAEDIATVVKKINDANHTPS